MMDTILTTTGHVSPLALFFNTLLSVPLGPDPSFLLAALGVIWGVFKIGPQVYDYIERFIDDYLMCSMTVSENDETYLQLMNWLSHQRDIKKRRNLMAQTDYRWACDEEEELKGSLSWRDVGEIGGENRMYLNFANQAARSIRRYVPAIGATAFWHKGTYFRFHRKKESVVNSHPWGGAIKDSEEIKISCFGRSTDPINRLLADVEAFYYIDAPQKTTIHCPRAKDQRRDFNMWRLVTRRPIRPIATVVLDSANKLQVLEGMNDYLHPQVSECFSFALAGVFGIDIYVISLQDASVNEEDLASLLNNLPRRCIVLLEDIDTAVLRRDLNSKSADVTEDNKSGEKSKNGKKEKHRSASNDGDDETESEVEIRPKKRASKKGAARNNNPVAVDGISLSGLLNAIDGVASHEGRILIMTTNKPDALDEALIRPGRVDVQVEFKNASSTQAAELFLRMYEASRKNATIKTATVQRLADKPDKEEPADELKAQPLAKHDAEELEGFGRRIPGGVFSAADIQGFILKRKDFPRRALYEVREWIEQTKRQKEANSKVSTVQ
ncbi:BCS1 N terminal domain-containing protein [Trichoderma sp. SZMC 28013]